VNLDRWSALQGRFKVFLVESRYSYFVVVRFFGDDDLTILHFARMFFLTFNIGPLPLSVCWSLFISNATF